MPAIPHVASDNHDHPSTVATGLRPRAMLMLACPSCNRLNPHFLGACLRCGGLLPAQPEASHFELWLEAFTAATVVLALAAGVALALN